MKRGRPSKDEIREIQSSKLDDIKLAKKLDRSLDFIQRYRKEIVITSTSEIQENLSSTPKSQTLKNMSPGNDGIVIMTQNVSEEADEERKSHISGFSQKNRKNITTCR